MTAAPIRAELSGDDTATAGDIVGTGSTPILTLCSKLLAAGHDPTTPLRVYRGAVLALLVRSISAVDAVTINAKGTGFMKRRQAVRRAPSIAPDAQGAAKRRRTVSRAVGRRHRVVSVS